MGGEVFAQPQLVEHGDGVGGGDFGGGAVGVEGDEDGDEALEDCRVGMDAGGEAGVMGGAGEVDVGDWS